MQMCLYGFTLACVACLFLQIFIYEHDAKIHNGGGISVSPIT